MSHKDGKVGYWLNDKKAKKLNIEELQNLLRVHGLHLVKMAEVYKSITNYFENHPPQIFMDVFDNIIKLLNRATTYDAVKSTSLITEGIAAVPKYIVLTSKNYDENVFRLRTANIKFPIVCKPLLSHGSPSAHQMALVFNEKGMEDCSYPCVAQMFINHNANLFKVFVIGNKHYAVRRSSLKDYPSGGYEGENNFCKLLAEYIIEQLEAL